MPPGGSRRLESRQDTRYSIPLTMAKLKLEKGKSPATSAHDPATEIPCWLRVERAAFMVVDWFRLMFKV